MKVIFMLLSLLLFTTSCTTGSSKDGIEMHFGDLPTNPFLIQKNKKGVTNE